MNPSVVNAGAVCQAASFIKTANTRQMRPNAFKNVMMTLNVKGSLWKTITIVNYQQLQIVPVHLWVPYGETT